MLLVNTLVREGVVVYVNNAEITRYNLGFELHPTVNNTINNANNTTINNAVNNTTNNTTNNTNTTVNNTHDPYAGASASYLFRFPRYTAASFSHLYLQQGVNTIAVEIHRHLLSNARVHFALQLLLLYTPEYQFSSSFPLVSSSVNVRAPRSTHA